MDSVRDSSAVPRHDDFILRQFVTARRAGDAATARRWWEELVTANFDRITTMVIVESHDRLSSDEQQEAVQAALIKLTNNMITTFRGSSVGEWVNATRKLVFGVCVDTQRRAATHTRHRAPLAATDDGGAEHARLDKSLYKALENERQKVEAREQDAEVAARESAFLDWAVRQLSPKRRAVIELDRQDVPGEEIQLRLGVSRDVVYASRSRALKDLAELRKDHIG